jgi:hypothetical protein
VPRTPLRVARVDERGPVRVRRRVHAFCEFSDERLCAREDRCGTMLQRSGEVKPSVALTRLARNPNARRTITVSGIKNAAPGPAEW